MTPTHDLPHAKSTWATALDEYVADMREAHGANAAVTSEAYYRADELMKAAQETVALCRKYKGDAEAAVEWIVLPDPMEVRLLALSVRVAELEAEDGR